MAAAGRLDLLVHNASTLGPTPLPPLAEVDPDGFDDVWLTNVAAPLALTQLLLPALRAARGVLVGISSDAAVEHYEGWGAYAASKAALDHVTLTLGAENPQIAAYAVDPGDMRTAMHQAAFPGEDISDRPLPEHGRPRPAQPAAAAARRTAGTAPSDFALGAGRRPRPPRRCRHDPAVRRAADPLRQPRTTPRHPRPPRNAAWPGTGCGCWWPPTRGWRTRTSGTSRHTWRPVTSSSSTTRRRSLPSSTRCCAVAGRWSCTRRRELDDGTWVVELRTAPDAARAVLDATGRSTSWTCPAGGRLTLLAPYPRADSSPTGRGNRLWRAAVTGPRPLEQHLVRYGRPIAYGYLDRSYPLSAYQTVFATRPGSAEMPSAARPFSPELVTRLVATGIGVAAVTLHTGVSSQEAGEAPQPEWFEVSATAARLVNATRAEGGRVVAVGHDRDPGARVAVDDDGRGGRDLRMDDPGRLAGRPAAGGDRPGDRVAQPGGVAPAARRGSGRPGL